MIELKVPIQSYFPLIKKPDGKGGYAEKFYCARHDLIFSAIELAAIHYNVDHAGKTKRRTGYQMLEASR